MKSPLGVLLAAMIAAMPVAAQDDAATLARDATLALQAAASAQEAAQTRSDRVAALTRTVRAYEDGLSALRAGLRQASLRERALQKDLDARSEDLSKLLGALAATRQSDGALTLLHPAGPVGTARAAMILSDISPVLGEEVARLKSEIEEIATLRAVQQGAQTALETALSGAQEARTALSQAIAARTDLPRRFTADPERMRELITASDTLSAFAGGLASMDLPALDLPPQTRAALPLPTQGRVVRRAGEADAAGVVRPGLLLATEPGALLTAPVAATIRYAGPLLDYGNVMILEPDSETLLVFAGLGALYGDLGEIVSAGDAIGLMPEAVENATEDKHEESEQEMGADPAGTLYIEVRKGDAAVNPESVFAVARQE